MWPPLVQTIETDFECAHDTSLYIEAHYLEFTYLARGLISFNIITYRRIVRHKEWQRGRDQSVHSLGRHTARTCVARPSTHTGKHLGMPVKTLYPN